MMMMMIMGVNEEHRETKREEGEKRGSNGRQKERKRSDILERRVPGELRLPFL